LGRVRFRIRKRSEPISYGIEQTERTRQILVRHLAEDKVANVLGHSLDLIDRPTSARREHEALRASIGLSSHRSTRPEFSRASSSRTTDEPSRDKDAASSFCRIGASDLAIRSKGSHVASVSPKTCKRASTARRHSRATLATSGANRARASFGASGMEI
jgi:hypothetical protein